MNQEQSVHSQPVTPHRETLVAKASRFLFGNDAFISYARRDATIYSLGLANQLTKKELSCFLDQWGTPSGKELPTEVVSTLKRSQMLILLGTERAAASEAVKREIIEFKKTGRTIIPVPLFVGVALRGHPTHGYFPSFDVSFRFASKV